MGIITLSRFSHFVCSHSDHDPSAVSRPSSLAWVGTPSLRRLSVPVRGGLSCGQPRISQALPDYGSDHAVKALKAVALYVALVQAEVELIQVEMRSEEHTSELQS